jgi:hypothetical protein
MQFRFPYIGLKGLDARSYLEGNNWLGVALSALMRVSDDDKARLKADAMLRLATSPLDAARRFLLCECVEAYLPLEGPTLAEYDQLLLTRKYREAHMIGQTSYEKGQTVLLQRMLQNRFGPLSAEAKRRLQAMSSGRLERLADDLPTADSLAQLGLEDEIKEDVDK